MKPATFAPAYCALYPKLAEITRSHGYALAAHGSMERDFDLICIPWTEQPSTPDEVVAAIVSKLSIRLIVDPKKDGDNGAQRKPHGRVAYTLSIGFGQCAADLSFMPISPGKGGAT